MAGDNLSSQPCRLLDWREVIRLPCTHLRTAWLTFSLPVPAFFLPALIFTVFAGGCAQRDRELTRHSLTLPSQSRIPAKAGKLFDRHCPHRAVDVWRTYTKQDGDKVVIVGYIYDSEDDGMRHTLEVNLETGKAELRESYILVPAGRPQSKSQSSHRQKEGRGRNLSFPRSLKGLQSVWAEVGKDLGLGDQPDVLWTLASESGVSCWRRGDKWFWVVEIHYRGDWTMDYMRGASGNGAYYVFLRTGRTLRKVLKTSGNSCKIVERKGRLCCVVTYHLSAYSEPETVYYWNGTVFE